MRIAVVHNLQPGGARRRLANQLSYLDGSVVEICLQTATPITDDAIVVPLRPQAPRRSRVLRPPLRYLDLAVLEHAWRRAAAHVISAHPDVIYLNPCRYLQAPPVLRNGGPPALYFCDEVRRVDAERGGIGSRNSLTLPVYAALYERERRLDRKTATTAEAIATNSRYTATEIQRVYGRVATVVRLGVTDALLAPSPDPPPAGASLLSVGTLIPTKGHDLALRAAALAEGRPLVRIVAPRPAPREEARLRALAVELGVPAEIKVAISDAELRDLYASATATVYLAEHEPLGLVSLEAQAQGCPVIVADEGGLPETIVEGVTGWSAPREAGAVASLANRLSDGAVRFRMSTAARDHARTWSWKASAAHVEQLISEVAGAQSNLPGEQLALP
jgi:glycosyltransferase involved in cell wall biosynthesis